MEDKKRKVLLEIKDMLMGTAFPFILMIVLNATIISYASYKEDIFVSLLALIGGEIMFIASLLLFGRANGANAYRNTVVHEKKRELGTSEETALLGTGEYALWKGAVIGGILLIPFLIFQTIELIVPNAFCSFCLQYACGWAYYPFSYLGDGYQGLNYICIIIPVGAHVLGYYWGKLRQINVDKRFGEAGHKKKGKGRKGEDNRR